MPFPTPNHDEGLVTSEIPFIGNFHKTLPHNEFGEVCPDAYRTFERTCLAVEAGTPSNFEGVPKGPLSPAFHPDADPSQTGSVAKFVSPLAGAATEELGPDPKDLEMPPAPGIQSLSTAAEMVELYWMALLRDLPLVEFSTDPDFSAAVADVAAGYNAALAGDSSDGAVKLVQDLPESGGALNIGAQTLFRSGLPDEEHGPLVSQFFLRDIPFGTQTIRQRQIPYRVNVDYLTTHEDWLRAQNTGKDKFGRDYGTCNYYDDQITRGATYYANTPRKIATMRDLARFVNRDALHQAYFSAALFLLDGVGAPLDPGIPYRGSRYSRELGFASLGGPDLLTLVSEVASRALKVVWRQKWLVHRRARPEVYGGLLQMQETKSRPYGLPSLALSSQGGQAVLNQWSTHFLPMAFSAGSPSHPAYGAGHATVAGACVTVLKAWFDEDAGFAEILAKANAANKQKEPGGGALKVLQPGARIGVLADDAFAEPIAYTGSDLNKLTIGGELNKIASNVAMGRSMGGVHWRTDNTRSLRLGEAIATEILRKRTMEYAERPVSFTFRAFDGHHVQVSEGDVRTY